MIFADFDVLLHVAVNFCINSSFYIYKNYDRPIIRCSYYISAALDVMNLIFAVLYMSLNEGA